MQVNISGEGATGGAGPWYPLRLDAELEVKLDELAKPPAAPCEGHSGVYEVDDVDRPLRVYGVLGSNVLARDP